MDNEDQFVNDNGTVNSDSASISNGRRFNRSDEPFPPALKWWGWTIVILCSFCFLIAGFYLIEQFCSIHPVSWLAELVAGLQIVGRPCVWGTYVALGIWIATIVAIRWVRHKLVVHKARREDRSEIEAMFVDARKAIKESDDNENKDVRIKGELIKKEKKRLENMGSNCWTEYQVLSLNQQLLDFLKVDELKASARLSLAQLEEYAQDSSYRYDVEQFYRWESAINEALEKIEQSTFESGDTIQKPEPPIEKLRAELKTLLEHVADYQANWAEGSAMIRDIIMCGAMVIPLFVVMGLLPVLHPASDGILGILNWGLLGITGAVTIVLRNLRKSDLVEVGNTEGKKELLRAILSTVMGLVAGVLGYSLIAGGIFATGSIVPKIDSDLSVDVGLAVLWAVASGFCFESIFDRVLSTTFGNN